MLRYLGAHPDAADTLDGVAVWWLSGKAPLAAVAQALETLVAKGLLQRRPSPDGKQLYSASRKS